MLSSKIMTRGKSLEGRVGRYRDATLFFPYGAPQMKMSLLSLEQLLSFFKLTIDFIVGFGHTHSYTFTKGAFLLITYSSKFIYPIRQLQDA